MANLDDCSQEVKSKHAGATKRPEGEIALEGALIGAEKAHEDAEDARETGESTRAHRRVGREPAPSEDHSIVHVLL